MNKEKGFALIFVLMVMSTMAILGTALFSRSIPERYLSERFVDSTQAFWLAEAGIQEAGFVLNSGDWTGWANQGATDKVKTASLGAGNYTVTVTDFSGANPIAVSAGTVKGVSRNIEATMRKSGSLFNAALSSQTQFQGALFNDVVFDSYDSSLGLYGGSNVGSKGNIITTAASAGAITLIKNNLVKGDVSTGPGGTVVLNDTSAVTGNITDDNNTTMNPVVIPADLSSLPSGGDYFLNGGAGTLVSGDYKFSSFKVRNGGKVTIDGTVRMYCASLPTSVSFEIALNGQVVINPGGKLIVYADGLFLVSKKGIANNTHRPKNLQIYSTLNADATWTMIGGDGSTPFEGVIYAPNTYVETNNWLEVYGSIVAKRIFYDSVYSMHYDEDLKVEGSTEQTGTAGSQYSVKQWKEQNNPYPLN